MNGATVKVLFVLMGATLCLAGWNAFGDDGRSPESEQGGRDEAVMVDGGVDASAADSPELAPELLSTAGVRVVRMVLARGVERTEKHRVPVEPGTAFDADGRRIYVYLEVDNPDETAGTISVSWLPPNGRREIGRVSVDVKASKRWRTWSYNRFINTPGIWHAVVRNPGGEVIARAPFEMRAVSQGVNPKSQ